MGRAIKRLRLFDPTRREGVARSKGYALLDPTRGG